MAPHQLKYTKEQMQEFMVYAKDNKIGLLKMMTHFGINRRTFYLTAYRYNLSTEEFRRHGWKTKLGQTQASKRAMSKEQVEEVLKYAEANRVSHKDGCNHFGYSYNTFRGAIIRFHVKAERFSSTYSKEDVLRVFEYAQANHISLVKACDHCDFKYHLLSTSAKRYKLKFERELVILDEAKELNDRDSVVFYIGKGYVANEIYNIFVKSGRKISRGMVYYYYDQEAKRGISKKIKDIQGQVEEKDRAKVVSLI